MLKIFFSLLLLVISAPAIAQPSQSSVQVAGWAQLPVLHEGRLKPIDSFARVHLKKFSNQESLDGLNASQWLARTLFTPEIAAQDKIFKVRNFKKYNLPKNKKKLYSYLDLSPVIEVQNDVIQNLLSSNEKKWTPEQQELVTLHNNLTRYAELLRSLTALLPLNSSSASEKNYLELKAKDNTNKAENNIITLIEAGGKNNNYFKILPKDWNEVDGVWFSIWNAIEAQDVNKNNEHYLSQWSAMADAYRENNQAQWDKAIDNAPNKLRTSRLKVEYFYNVLKLLTIATIAVFLSFCLTVAANIFSNNKLREVAFYGLILGLFANILDIIFRVYILARPPVGTLYESIIFVSVICVAVFLFIEKKQKNQIGLILGSISGVLLLTVARSFAGDDTMDTLVAVLNTNFWLLTHVICITIGYGVCFIAALIAHYYLIAKIWRPNSKEHFKTLSAVIKTFVIISLLFTTIGTILGGIWADQSWGRFWGWDPKENGALLIVLWLIWLIHGRISKHISETGFIVGSACLSIVVVLAWFGVNLLSVGLHSYGFISGVAMGIAVFCTLETLFILSLWWFGREKQTLT